MSDGTVPQNGDATHAVEDISNAAAFEAMEARYGSNNGLAFETDDSIAEKILHYWHQVPVVREAAFRLHRRGQNAR